MDEVVQKDVPPIEEPKKGKRGWIFIVLVALVTSSWNAIWEELSEWAKLDQLAALAT